MVFKGDWGFSRRQQSTQRESKKIDVGGGGGGGGEGESYKNVREP